MNALAAIVLVVLFALGAPIFAVMLAAGAYGASQLSGSDFTGFFGNQMQSITTLGTGEPATILSTIPLFIFVGFLMAESKTADRLVRFAQPLFGWLPGGLAIVTILTCALFTTFTGASGVTIVALGGLIMPSLLKERYSDRFSLGLVTGTGSVGLLFPPALPLFVFGTVYGLNATDEMKAAFDFSTDRFLFAGIVPGLVLIAVIALYSVVVALRSGVPRHKITEISLSEVARSFAVALPEVLLPFLVIIGLTLGGLSIPEVACLSAVYILLIEVALFRDLKITDLPRVIRDSMMVVGAIFIVIFAASAFTQFLIDADVPDAIFDFIRNNFESKWSFLLALNVFLLFVGMTMDIFSAIIVCVPLIIPVAFSYGIEPYHLGIIFLLNLEIGYLTPPVGLNLFITQLRFDKPIAEVIRASMPFLGCMVIALGLVTYLPALTVVPPAERRGRVSLMMRDIEQAYKRISAIKELTMPDGKVMTLDSCESIEDNLTKADCRGLFVRVTECRNSLSGDAAAECESKAIADYQKFAADDLDLGDFDDLDALGDDTGGGEAGGSDAGPGSESGDDDELDLDKELDLDDIDLDDDTGSE